MEKKGLTREESLALKAAAVLLLIVHHTLRFPSLYDGYTLNFFPLVESQVSYISEYSKISVGIFAFISGYGITRKYRNSEKSVSQKAFSQYWNAMKTFWPIFILALLVTAFVSGKPFSVYQADYLPQSILYVLLDGLGLAQLMKTPMLTGSWWYLSTMVVLLVFAPIFQAAVKRLGWAAPCFLLAALPRLLNMSFPGDIHPVSFLMPVFLGVLFAEYNVFEFLASIRLSKDDWLNRWLRRIGYAIILLLSYKGYHHLPLSQVWEYHYGIAPVVFILAFLEWLPLCSPLKGILSRLGRHSGNIFLVHDFVLGFRGLLYSMPWFGLIPLAVYLICLVFSMVLEVGKNRFYEKISKPVRQNRPISPLDWLREYWRNESFRSLVSPCLFAMTLLLLDMGLRSLHSGVGVTTVFDPIPQQFTLSWIVMLTAITLLLPGLLRKISIGTIGGIFLILFLTHSMMMQAKGNFFSFNSLMYAADGFRFLDVSYIQVGLQIWFVFFLGLLMLVLSVLLAPEKGPSIWRVIICLVLIVAGIGLVNVNREKNLTNRLQNHFNIYQNSLLYDNFTDSNSCVMLCGMYQYTFRDFCVTYGVYDSVSHMNNHDTIAALDDWYGSKELDEDNDWTGRFAGKNMIMIQLEAIDSWMINEQFMPNLYHIQQESINFANHYAPMYSDAGTFNTEMIANTGMVAPFVGAKSSMYSRNDYPYSLANLMALDGCKVDSFHRSPSDTYNRGVIHANWGYAQYYSGADMGIPSDRLDFDTELMRAYDVIAPVDERFFSFIITYSAHGPYEHGAISDYYYDTAENLLPEDTDEMIVHAMARAKVTDEFVGQLYARLEADGLLDDTVLVFYSDHYDYYVQKRELILEIKEAEDFDMASNTPFFIYEKNTAPMNVTKVTSSIDILPTLANLFALNTDGRYYIGNDAFSSKGGYVIFKNFSWYDGETYWNTAAPGELTSEVQARNEELMRRLEMSWDSMRINYFNS